MEGRDIVGDSLTVELRWRCDGGCVAVVVVAWGWLRGTTRPLISGLPNRSNFCASAPLLTFVVGLCHRLFLKSDDIFIICCRHCSYRSKWMVGLGLRGVVLGRGGMD